MKKTLLTIATLAALTATTFAQGTFSLSSAKGTKPAVLAPDGSKASGANYTVDVKVLNPATSAFEGVLKSGAAFTGTGLFANANAGLFSGGTLTVPFLAPGADATIKIYVWDKTTGATFADAAASGISGSTQFSIKLGGVVDPNTGIPSLPSDIVPAYTGVTLSQAVISNTPEPSTYALLALGVGSLLYFRRK